MNWFSMGSTLWIFFLLNYSKWNVRSKSTAVRKIYQQHFNDFLNVTLTFTWHNIVKLVTNNSICSMWYIPCTYNSINLASNVSYCYFTWTIWAQTTTRYGKCCFSSVRYILNFFHMLWKVIMVIIASWLKSFRCILWPRLKLCIRLNLGVACCCGCYYY